MTQKIQRVLFLYTESSLHAGTGSTVSVVDLPIQRERTTEYPIVQSTGIKGALRSQYSGNGDTESIFGPDTDKADSFAGALSVGDARIVLFPLQSLAGVFAYATSAAVLARLQRDLSYAKIQSPAIEPPPADSAFVTGDSNLIAGGRVVLEEFSFEPQQASFADEWAQFLATHALPAGEEYAYWRDKLLHSLIILPDDDFREFTKTSTEIVTRVRLDPGTKTVKTGALWTQESLPSDTLLYSSIIVNASRSSNKMSAEDVFDALQQGYSNRIQVGGDETTGSGFVAMKWL